MNFMKLIKMSVASVWGNKVRSFLTMLGIIIGISSVMVLVGMGEGTKQQVAAQIEKLGTNLLTVNIVGNRNKSISIGELNELKQKPGIKDIAPALTQGSVNIKAGDNTATTTVTATTPNYSEIRKMDVGQGRFINQRDLDNRYNVAVIGVNIADELYGNRNVVGQNINVNGVNFEIIGVLQVQGNSANGSGDDTLIMPLDTAQRLFKNMNVRTFYVEATNKDKVSDAMAYLQLFLNKKFNNDQNSYRVFDQTSLLDTANQTNDSMTTMLSGVAAISLLVGGIGIMNIMLVSVIERTKEIGIRKAIGAKRRVILAQFLLESAGISSFGGILGVALGFLASYIAKNFMKIPIVISNNVVLGSFLFSLLVGIVFGMYPANKASKLNPIDALRFE